MVELNLMFFAVAIPAVIFAGIIVLLQVIVIARALSWRHFSMLRGGAE